MNYSNRFQKVFNEAVVLSKQEKRETNIYHVLLAIQKEYPFFSKYVDRQAYEAVIDKLRRNTTATTRVSTSQELSAALQIMLDLAENSNWVTGEAEISHFIIGYASMSMTVHALRCASTPKKLENLIRQFQKIEAEDKGLEFAGIPGESSDGDYYTDMVKEQEKRTRPFIGRDAEMELLVNTLARLDKPNAILCGKPGVGKTDVVRGFAKMLLNKEVPECLRDATLYNVDVSGMVAGAQFRGQFEERLKGTIEEIMEDPQPIIFLDEIHTVVGAGTSSQSTMDAANILKPYLTDGKIRVIGATTDEEYRRVIESDKAFMRRFARIDVDEPSESDTVKILKGLKSTYEDYHHVKILDESIKTAVRLTSKYMTDRYLPDKAIDIIDSTAARLKNHGLKKMTASDVEEQISKVCHIPAETAKADDMAAVRTLDRSLSASVFGQDEAVKTVTEYVKMSKAGLGEEGKPIGSFLFVGPSGVGKTEIAKQLAKSMGISFQRFDMSEYQESHAVAKLIGSPAGYVGYDDGGLLIETVRQNPHCVLLFDEIEKAHPDIYKLFLQIFDYGTLSDNKGRKADFRNCIIIMTSNAGSTMKSKSLGFNSVLSAGPTKETAIAAVEKMFPPELRGRIDATVVFNPLSKDMARLVVKKDLVALGGRLKAKGIKAAFSDAAINRLVELGCSDTEGARMVQKAIDSNIKKLFVQAIINGTAPEKCTVDFCGGRFMLRDDTSHEAEETTVDEMTDRQTV